MAVSSPRKSSRDSRVAPEAFYGDLDQLLKKGSPKPAFRQIIEWVRQIAEAHNILQRDHFKPGRVRVHKNGTDQTGIATGTTEQITYSTAAIDTNGWFDLTADRYTPKRSGIYVVMGRLSITGGAVGQNVRNRLYKNGTDTADLLHQYDAHHGVAADQSVGTAIDIVEMNGDTDWIEHHVRNSSGNTIAVEGDEFATAFLAWRLL